MTAASSAGPERAKRVGVLGGTFDPIHVGHLVAAVNARHSLSLDIVLLVVANQPWQKLGVRTLTSARDRLAVVEAAVAGVPGIEASAIEIERGGLSYTADTLQGLESDHPGAEFFVIIGADVVAGLATWERTEEIRKLASLVIVNRPGSKKVDPEDDALSGWNVVAIEIPALEISSTDLRERAATGRPLDYLVPESAVRVIRQRGLYDVTR